MVKLIFGEEPGSKRKAGSKRDSQAAAEDEYVLVLTGVKDTGLCGKYWSDSESLPSKRRRVSNQPEAASPAPATSTPKPGSDGEERRGPGRPKKSSVISEATNPEQSQSQSPAKKGRGRPKKSDVNIEAKESAWQPTVRLDRSPVTRKTDPAEEKSEKQPKEAEPERPKQPVAQNLTEDESEAENPAAPAKRGRGRPKKIRSDGELNSTLESSSSQQSSPVKRPRGRPKKSDVDVSSPSKAVSAQFATPDGRGRPRRKPESSDSEDNNPFPVPTAAVSPSKKKPMPLQKLPASGPRRATDDEESVTMVHNDFDASTRARRAQMEGEARQFGAQQQRSANSS
jgi:hypothetical protein